MLQVAKIKVPSFFIKLMLSTNINARDSVNVIYTSLMQNAFHRTLVHAFVYNYANNGSEESDINPSQWYCRISRVEALRMRVFIVEMLEWRSF